MYYKVLKDGKTIDVLKDSEIVYLRYQERYDRMIFCDESEAQAIFSSDRKYIWHVDGLYNIPVHDRYDNVQLEEIDVYEYEQLRVFGMKTVEDVIDQYTLTLIQNKVI